MNVNETEGDVVYELVQLLLCGLEQFLHGKRFDFILTFNLTSPVTQDKVTRKINYRNLKDRSECYK